MSPLIGTRAIVKRGHRAFDQGALTQRWTATVDDSHKTG
jgi:hypothetical protein